MIKKRNYSQKSNVKVRSILLTFLAVGIIGVMQTGCNYGFESTQEAHENPYDPMYYSTEGRLILGEPEITEGTTNTIRIYWKTVHTNGVFGSDYTYTAYYFTDTEKDQVFDILRNNGDPSVTTGLLQPVDPAPNFDPKKAPEELYFEDPNYTTGQNYYYVVKFIATDASFSNIVVYPPPSY